MEMNRKIHGFEIIIYVVNVDYMIVKQNINEILCLDNMIVKQNINQILCLDNMHENVERFSKLFLKCVDTEVIFYYIKLVLDMLPLI